jgi:hypothetical protein
MATSGHRGQTKEMPVPRRRTTLIALVLAAASFTGCSSQPSATRKKTDAFAAEAATTPGFSSTDLIPSGS